MLRDGSYCYPPKGSRLVDRARLAFQLIGTVLWYGLTTVAWLAIAAVIALLFLTHLGVIPAPSGPVEPGMRHDLGFFRQAFLGP